MEILKGLLQYFTGIFTNEGNFWGNITVNGGTVTWAVIILLTLMFCAFASYEFMNSIGKNGKLYFWLGLCIPVVFMLYCLFKMIAVKHAAVAAARKALEASEEERAAKAAEQLRIDSTPSKENFAKIKANADGSFDGPFKLDLADGTFLMVAKIQDVQDTLAVMELVPEGDAAPRVLRMPYAKMTSISRAE